MNVIETGEFVAILKAAVSDLTPDYWGNEDPYVRSYSGRGMYGKSCVGVALASLAQAVELGYILGLEDAAGDDDSNRLTKLVRDATFDDLGRGVILYFPSTVLADDDMAQLFPDDYDPDE